jgi:hypothetical protein
MSAEAIAPVHSARDIAAMRRAVESMYAPPPKELAAFFIEPAWLIEDLVIVALEQGGHFTCGLRGQGERFAELAVRGGPYVRHADYLASEGWRGQWVIEPRLLEAFETERGRVDR